ncbi:MAG: Ribonuclease H [candidate division WWE3 bacterium GW2011_GWC1_41_7]|uniref:Ribonuclease H n=4 Tax=Katanobacteria TaxID=422282 RepID=A0A0G0ZFX6_UNCKA|nr:MAG: Ribonuclease H [candidate division WWE3 bacterium GW2011_GWB1_41_6]KKS20956.1 MAG: Ribonuclease H [candidate division WWE3 bacterium GW2011_GWC1_41_7]OGC57079.1 MAG: hypothetical protein A2976_01785 [candidate division WWE3 bacterium RIFCSPLOWO2_01_FULL_41_9]
MKMVLNTDGGARGNPGPGALGVVLRDSSNEKIYEMGKYLGVCTNNEAEYLALIEGMAAAHDKKAKTLVCKLDSELVVKQLKGQYKVKNERLKVLYARVKELEKNFSSVGYEHIPRTKNHEADSLVNKVLDAESR